jgi:osmotically-inducible protein OsmY
MKALWRFGLAAGVAALAWLVPAPSAPAQQVADATTTAKIATAFLFNEHLNPYSIQAETRDGTVTLSGTVDNRMQRDLAERVAKSIEGVRQVVNNIRIAGQASQAATETRPKAQESPQPQVSAPSSSPRLEQAQREPSESIPLGGPSEVDEAALTAAIQTRLEYQRGVDERGVRIEVRNGEVTLEGTVPSQQQLRQIEEIVGSTRGVTAVYNRLEVTGESDRAQTARSVEEMSPEQHREARRDDQWETRVGESWETRPEWTEGTEDEGSSEPGERREATRSRQEFQQASPEEQWAERERRAQPRRLSAEELERRRMASERQRAAEERQERQRMAREEDRMQRREPQRSQAYREPAEDRREEARQMQEREGRRSREQAEDQAERLREEADNIREQARRQIREQKEEFQDQVRGLDRNQADQLEEDVERGMRESQRRAEARARQLEEQADRIERNAERRVAQMERQAEPVPEETERREGTALEGARRQAREWRDEAGEQAREFREQAEQTAENVQKTVRDEWMEKRIEADIMLSRDVSIWDLDVEVQNGVARLSGRVDNPDERQIVERIARQTDGIREVRNDIRVGQEESRNE